MNVAAAITILATAASLALGAYVISLGPGRRLNQVFLAITIALALWGVGDIISLLAHTHTMVLVGRHIALTGWCFVGSLALHFMLELSRHEKLLHKWWLYVALYAPFTVVLIIGWSTNLVYSGIVNTSSGVRSNIGVLWYLTYVAIVAELVLGIVVLYLYRRRTSDPVERERVGLVILAASIPFVGSVVTEWLIPYRGIRPPVNAMTFLIIMAAIIAYAVSKRGLMSTLLAAVGGTIVSMMNDPVLILDSTGHIDTVNTAAMVLTGYTEDELRGSTLEMLFGSSKEGLQVVESASGAFDTSESADCATRDGSFVPVAVASANIKRSGNLLGSVVVMHDMRVALDLVRAEERAHIEKAHSEELKDIIDVAAHELRHPATVLKGYASLLATSWQDLDAGTVTETLATLDDASDRISRLAIDLLDASYMGSGDIALERTDFKPLDAIANAVEEVLLKGFEKESVVVWGEEDPVVNADEVKVEAALAILLDNAVKFASQRPIEAWFEQGPAETVFSVADRGPGIPAEHRARIFERFYQVDSASHHSLPGMGLGLYIARMIVEAHGGWIKVEAREGGGSLFTFSLPNGT